MIRTRPLTLRLREAQRAFERSCNDLKRARASSSILVTEDDVKALKKADVGIDIEGEKKDKIKNMRMNKKSRSSSISSDPTSPLDFSFHLLAFLLFQTNYYIILPTVFSHVIAFRMPIASGVVLFTAVPIGTGLLNFMPTFMQTTLRKDIVSRFFVAALGNMFYGFAVVSDYLLPGMGIWCALLGRLLIGFSAFGQHKILEASSTNHSKNQWRTHIFDDDRDVNVNFKWRLCYAVMRTLSSATGLMIGMVSIDCVFSIFSPFLPPSLPPLTSHINART